MTVVLLLATRNPHKAREIFQILKGLPVEIATLEDYPALPEVPEDQPTIEGNAIKKAAACAKASGLWSLADDTGLEVEALSGAPGVFSARYAALENTSLSSAALGAAAPGAGQGCDYAANNRKLLSALAGIPREKRKAVFRTVVALADPLGKTTLAEGRLEGSIAQAPRGKNGFGYDPVFYVPQARKTLAEMPPEEKNALSHRSAALKRIVPHIKRLLVSICVICGSSFPSWARRTEPGSETIWDQIMASQANRGLRLGSRYLEDKRYDLAVREFERAVSANPKDPTAHMMLGVAYYWTGEVERSLEAYRKSLEIDAGNAQAYMLIGISLAWKGDYKASYAAFKKAAEMDSGRADVQMNLGSIEESLGMIPEALGRFRTAVGLAPKEPLYHFQLGMLYRKLGRDQDAAESLRQALKLYSEFEDALLELGAIDERRGDRKAAIHSFKKAVDLKSRDSVARLRLGRLYLLSGEPRKAREAFAEAFHLTPEEGGGGLQLSVSYSGGRRAPGTGAQEPSAPPAEAPQPESNDPLEIFSRNLERIPLDRSALMQVDVVFVPKPKLMKAPAESPSALKEALAKQVAETERGGPQAVRREYQIRAGKSEERTQAIAQVLEDLRQVMRQAPEDSDVRLGMNLNFTRLSEAPSGRGDAEGRSRVSYQPRQVGNDLGLWVIGTGWMALVEEVLPEPGERPGHPEASDWWVATGLAYATLGEGHKALSAFERACSLDPKNEIAFLGRGVASVMTGNESQAVASYQEALKLNAKNRPAGEGLKWLLRPSTKKEGAKGGAP